MSLGRITIWSSGQVLTAAALNAEFNNILTNALQLISPLTGNLNVNAQQLINVRVENRSSAPNAGNPGRLSFDLGTNTLWVDAGSLNVSALSQPAQRVSGLKGQTSTGSSLITLSADSYICQTTDRMSATETVASSNITCFLASSDGGPGHGAGGRDTASTFGAGTVHLYALTTGMFSTAPALIGSLTTPPGFPTMSTSQAYTHACYVGSVIFSTAGDVPSGVFSGSRFYYNSLTPLVTHTTPIQSPVPVVITTLVPTNAVSFETNIEIINTTMVSTNPEFLGVWFYYTNPPLLVTTGVPFPTVNPSRRVLVGSAPVVAAVENVASASLSFPVRSGSTAGFYYYFPTSFPPQTSSASVEFRLDVVNYVMPNGDV